MVSHTPSAGPSTSATTASAGNQGASVPVTGEQYELSAGDYRAVVTGLGAGLRELSRGGTPVLSGYEPDESPPGAAASSSSRGPTASTAGATTSGAPATSWTSAKREMATRSTGSPGSPPGCRCGTSRTAWC